MHQKQIRNAVQPLHSQVIVTDKRLIGYIAAGHDAHVRPVVEQHPVQRCITQHPPQGIDTLRHVRGQCRVLCLGKQYNGTRCTGQHGLGFSIDLTVTFDHCHRRRHQGKGLVVAVLAFPQACHSLFVTRVHGQVKSTHTLDRHNLALFQGLRCQGHALDGVCFPGLALGIGQPAGRTAGRAGHGLSMEPSICRIVILLLAGLAQVKCVHGRVGPIIGHGFDNGISRTAVRAVDEGVRKTKVAGVLHLRQTRITHRSIRRDLHQCLA